MRRPPTTLGILSIVFGALTLLATLVNGAASARFDARPVKKLTMQLTRDARLATSQALGIAGHDFMSLMHSAHVVMALSLVILGIGLCLNREWARRAGVIWGVVGVALLVISLFIWSAVWNPRYEALLRAAYAQHDLEYHSVSTWVYVFVTVCYGLIAVFPVAMILQLRAPKHPR